MCALARQLLNPKNHSKLEGGISHGTITDVIDIPIQEVAKLKVYGPTKVAGFQKLNSMTRGYLIQVGHKN